MSPSVPDSISSSSPDALKTPLSCWHESLVSARRDVVVSIDEDGAFLKTDRPLPVGTAVFLELSLGHASNAARAEIDAVVTQEQGAFGVSGFRVRFVELDDAIRTWIRKFTNPPTSLVDVSLDGSLDGSLGVAPDVAAPAAADVEPGRLPHAFDEVTPSPVEFRTVPAPVSGPMPKIAKVEAPDVVEVVDVVEVALPTNAVPVDVSANNEQQELEQQELEQQELVVHGVLHDDDAPAVSPSTPVSDDDNPPTLTFDDDANLATLNDATTTSVERRDPHQGVVDDESGASLLHLDRIDVDGHAPPSGDAPAFLIEDTPVSNLDGVHEHAPVDEPTPPPASARPEEFLFEDTPTMAAPPPSTPPSGDVHLLADVGVDDDESAASNFLFEDTPVMGKTLEASSRDASFDDDQASITDDQASIDDDQPSIDGDQPSIDDDNARSIDDDNARSIDDDARSVGVDVGDIRAERRAERFAAMTPADAFPLDVVGVGPSNPALDEPTPSPFLTDLTPLPTSLPVFNDGTSASALLHEIIDDGSTTRDVFGNVVVDAPRARETVDEIAADNDARGLLQEIVDDQPREIRVGLVPSNPALDEATPSPFFLDDEMRRGLDAHDARGPSAVTTAVDDQGVAAGVDVEFEVDTVSGPDDGPTFHDGVSAIDAGSSAGPPSDLDENAGPPTVPPFELPAWPMSDAGSTSTTTKARDAIDDFDPFAVDVDSTTIPDAGSTLASAEAPFDVDTVGSSAPIDAPSVDDGPPVASPPMMTLEALEQSFAAAGEFSLSDVGSSAPLEDDDAPLSISPADPMTALSMTFDGPSKPFDDPSNPFDGRSKPFDDPSNPFDGRSNPFDGPSNPFDGRSNPFDGPSNPFDGPPPTPEPGPRPPRHPTGTLPFGIDARAVSDALRSSLTTPPPPSTGPAPAPMAAPARPPSSTPVDAARPLSSSTGAPRPHVPTLRFDQDAVRRAMQGESEPARSMTDPQFGAQFAPAVEANLRTLAGPGTTTTGRTDPLFPVAPPIAGQAPSPATDFLARAAQAAPVDVHPRPDVADADMDPSGFDLDLNDVVEVSSTSQLLRVARDGEGNVSSLRGPPPTAPARTPVVPPFAKSSVDDDEFAVDLGFDDDDGDTTRDDLPVVVGHAPPPRTDEAGWVVSEPGAVPFFDDE